MDAGELSHPASMPSFTKLLSIHLIFNEIVQHLTVPDLISCSAVSPGWCSTFRDYLHRNRECRLVLTWAIRPCRQLKELNQLLKRCSPEDHEGLTPDSYSTFLSKVHFTSLVIFWLEIDQDKTQCPAGACMKKIMEVHAGVLETLTVLNTSALDSGSILDYFSVDPQIRSTWLAKLKTLKVGSVCNSGIEGYYTPTNHLEEVLKASPNLKRITGPLGRELFDEAFNFKSLKTLQLEFEECMMLDYYSTLLDYPCNEMQTFPLFSRVTALKLSREFPGLDIEITIEPEKILPGAEICDETYSRLLEDPRLYKISPCHHKLERPHRQSHFGLVKYKFNVVCK